MQELEDKDYFIDNIRRVKFHIDYRRDTRLVIVNIKLIIIRNF